MLVGEKVFPLLAGLTAAQQKLLDIYVARAQDKATSAA